jgi:hypothetical protein
VEDEEVLEKVKKEYVTPGETVIVVYDYDKYAEKTAAWCKEHGWLYKDKFSITGREAQCVIVLSNDTQPEAISRGRNLLVMVTADGRLVMCFRV